MKIIKDVNKEVSSSMNRFDIDIDNYLTFTVEKIKEKCSFDRKRSFNFEGNKDCVGCSNTFSLLDKYIYFFENCFIELDKNNYFKKHPNNFNNIKTVYP
jgi:hypothetical protein